MRKKPFTWPIWLRRRFTLTSPMKMLAARTQWVQRLVSKDSPESISRKYILAWNASANITANLAGGNFLVGLYTILNISDVFLGTITTLIQFCNIFQILSPLLLDRFKYKKPVLLVTRIIYWSLYIIIIGIIPFIPGEDGLRIGLLLAVMAVANIVNAIAAPGYDLLHIRSIPKESRADFFSILSLLNYVCIYSFILICGNIVDYFRSHGSFLAGLTTVRILAVIFAVLEIYSHCHIHEFEEPEKDPGLRRPGPFIPLKNKQFTFCVMLMGFYNFFANIPGAYYSSYLIKDLVVPYSFLGIISFLSVPCMIIFIPVWNKIIKKRSWFGTISLSLMLASLHYAGLLFVNNSNYYFLYTVLCIYYYMIVPGINIVATNLPFYRLPEGDRTVYLAFYRGFNSFMAMLGFFTGSLFIANTSGLTINFNGRSFGNKQYIMVVTGILLLILGLIYRSISKKEQA